MLRKDLALFLRESAAMNLNASGLNSLLELLQQADDTSIDGLDYCALHELTHQA